MVSYLAFDTKSIRSLLSESNSDYFQSDHPIFYKNEDGTSAIDVALQNNQIRSVNLMINYICNHQNSYVYAHLFEHNLVDLINKGVDMKNLFNSQVLQHDFDFDEWPATNADTERMLNPYNDSIFKLRMSYGSIFKSIYDVDSLKTKEERHNEKVFKIKYKINLLSSMSENSGKIISAIANSSELDIFSTKLVTDLIDFKWKQFAQRSHFIGAAFHVLYISFMMAYII